MLRVQLAKDVAGCLLLLMPAVLSAQNTVAAVIFPAGTVYLNGAQLSNSSAFMTGDVLQTRENGAANINVAGSSAVVDSNSIVRFQGDGFSLDRGSISIATGKGLSVYARDFQDHARPGRMDPVLHHPFQRHHRHYRPQSFYHGHLRLEHLLSKKAIRSHVKMRLVAV